jgi:hypothetical protein
LQKQLSSSAPSPRHPGKALRKTKKKNVHARIVVGRATGEKKGRAGFVYYFS